MIRKRFPRLVISKGIPNSKFYQVAQAMLLFLLMFCVVSIGLLPTRYSLGVGEVSPETIYAHQEVTDHAATAEAKHRAEAAVEDIYLVDHHVAEEISEAVVAMLDFVAQLEPGEMEAEELLELWQAQFPDEEVDPQLVTALHAMDEAQLTNVIDRVHSIIATAMETGVKEDDDEKNTVRQHIRNELYGLPAEPVVTNMLVSRLDDNFRHNEVFSPAATENARRNAAEQVEDIIILKGAKIIDQGETVTEEHLSQLNALGLLQSSYAYGYYVGLTGILLSVFGVWAFYLYRFRRDIFTSPSRVLLLGSIVLISLAAAKGFQMFSPSSYLMPATLAVMLLTIIFDLNLALFFGGTFAILLGIIAGGELNLTIVALVGNIVAGYSVLNVNQRSDLTRAGLLVAAANTVVILGITLTGEGISLATPSLQRTLTDVGMGIGGGLLASVFAIGFLPFFENAFGVTTSVRLLELANPNQPPLKRLLLEAPGTYHHSIVVGNLAEAAAEAVGADPILARVGAYYHDLGKLSRPYFFIENQFSGSNPHDKIPPSLSSMILIGHVKAGVELANQFKLPPVIRDIIQQHHGDSLITFFYHRAVTERGGKDQLLEEKFRYEGPKPQFKEAGLIMLADSVEAAVRSLSQPNQSRITTMVKKIVQDKLADGQLDHCDLTLKDLNLAGDAFVRVLTGILHKRVAYPSEKELSKIGS